MLQKKDVLKCIGDGKLIVDISRDFLNTNGDVKKTNIKVSKPNYEESYFNKKQEVLAFPESESGRKHQN